MRIIRSALATASLVSSSSRGGRRGVSTDGFTSHASMSELADRYDAFILDQFGVLHNGVTALDGAIDCVEQLYKAGKKLIILSNTSAPSDKALLKLPKLGFNSNHFTSGAVTSGEEASKYILQTYGSDPSVARKALMLTWDTTDLNNPRLTALPQQFLEQCGNIDVAETVQEADFLLLHGSEVWYRGPKLEPLSLTPFITHGSLESVNPLLEECGQRNLPMVCANPDNIVRTPDGGDAHMPGKLATRYTQLVDPNSVDCRVFGKPHVEHFQACLKKLQKDHGIAADRVAHVGDSLHHDIAGASSAGIASIWTTSSGIHANDLGLDFGQQPTTQQVRDLVKKEGTAEPTHVLPAFLW